MWGKFIYGIIIVCAGFLVNLMIVGTDGLEKEEKLSVYLWSIVLIVILTRKYYK